MLQREEQDWNRTAGVKIWLRGRQYKSLSPARSTSLSLLLPPAPPTAATSTTHSGIWVQSHTGGIPSPGARESRTLPQQSQVTSGTNSYTQITSPRDGTHTNTSSTPQLQPSQASSWTRSTQNKPCQKADLSKPFYCPSQSSDRLKA